MAQVTIVADGKKISVSEGKTLLPALLAAGFDIPHMCYNEDIPPFGACRLCLVEIEENGRTRVMPSCTYPAREGLVVRTDTERIQKHRRMVAELLLARCPDVPQIQELATKLGVNVEGRFAKKDEGCILCGLCTRVCEQVVGVSAISFAGRGPEKQVATPFLDESKACIGCGSCYYICPVDYIVMEEDEKERRFPQWKVAFEMVRCKKCGQKVGPRRQLEYLARMAKLPSDWYDTCQDCRPGPGDKK